MKSKIFTFLALAICMACNNSSTLTIPREDTIADTKGPKMEPVPGFQAILDSHQIKGSILIFDAYHKTFYSNDFERSNTGYLPASTFKITNSIIGLETGMVDSNYIFKWDGKARRLKSWDKDMNLYEAYHASCVPCYQELAKKIGTARMNEYLKKFEYGNMVVVDSSLDKFWLEGPSRISQMQQIQFLDKLKLKQLPISEQTYAILEKIMLLEKTADYKLYGKTGWSIRDGFDVGWFVGWFQTADKVYFVATNVEPTPEFDMDNFGRARMQVSQEAFALIKKLLE
jgi:beta-lactamase class D